MSNATKTAPDFDLVGMANSLADANAERDAAFKALSESHNGLSEALRDEARKIEQRICNLNDAYYMARDVVFRQHGEKVGALSA